LSFWAGGFAALLFSTTVFSRLYLWGPLMLNLFGDDHHFYYILRVVPILKTLSFFFGVFGGTTNFMKTFAILIGLNLP
jgi:hypothetical protein